MTPFFRKTVFLCGILMLFALVMRAQNTPKFKVIAFYSASFDVAHISFAHEACGYFARLADEYNFQFDSTKDWNNLNDNFLSQYQVVMFFDNIPGGSAQRSAFQRYMERGGGFIGFHVCAYNDNPAAWNWYHNQFLATGRFRTNTWGPTSAILKVEDNTHPFTSGLPIRFRSAVSEWYGWTNDLRNNPDIKILCSIDPSSFPLGTDPNQSWYSGYYPIVWTNKNYKMLYANFGHNDIDYAHGNATKSYTFSVPEQNSIVTKALLSFGGATAPVTTIPGTLQAETYDVSKGIRKENTSDAGGGQNIGYIDATDWLDYKVNVTSAGSYKVEIRVASQNGGGSFQLKSGNTVLATVNVPSTSGWQSWITINTTVNLQAGAQTLRLQTLTGGFNLNWLKFSTDVINQTPNVSLTSPAANSSFTAPASITISANASDVDGTITKVDFYNGTTLLNSDATAPYSYVWSGVAGGTYSLTAVATDNGGATRTSAAVTVNVTVCSPASASSDDGNVPANVLDNNLNTRWSANGDGQWIQFCLDQPQDVSGVQIAFYNGNVRRSFFDIHTSLNGSDWTSALSNVSSSGTSLALENFTFTSRSAKYVRITGHGNSVSTWNSFTEVKMITGPVTPLPNKLPTVSITSPANNAKFNTPANITINATAADADGSISKVEFYNGTTLLGTDVTAPYSFNWTAVPVGAYSLTAVATDDSSAMATSSVVTISVMVPPNQTPVVSITSPTNNTNFNAPATITINATASDADGSISKVEFYNGTTLLNTDVAAPYSYIWSPVQVGTYVITAKAFDNVNALTTSAAVSVKVNPVVTNPCSGIAVYSENNGYVAGSVVQNAGARYQCKPYPYSGWCNGSAWAYAPGTGAYWTDAWTNIGSCAAARIVSENADETGTMIVNGNPFVESTNIDVVIAEAGDVSIKVYNGMGQEVAVLFEGYLSAGTYNYIFNASSLKADMYLVKMNSGENVSTLKVIKTE